MICTLFFLLFSPEASLRLLQQKPLSPHGALASDKGLRWVTPAIELEVDPLLPSALNQYLLDHGASPEGLNLSAKRLNWNAALGFRIRIHNLGEETLAFNPDQIILITEKGLVGSMLDMTEFWPVTKPDASIEKLASLFARGSQSLSSGESLEQLVVFMPTEKRFPKRMTLHFDRIYYGIEVLDFKIEYVSKYKK